MALATQQADASWHGALARAIGCLRGRRLCRVRRAISLTFLLRIQDRRSRYRSGPTRTALPSHHQSHGMRDVTMAFLVSGQFPDPAFESAPSGNVQPGILMQQARGQ
jgi:hypothetical protein